PGPAEAPGAPARTPERAARHWSALQQGTGEGRAAVAAAARDGATPPQGEPPSTGAPQSAGEGPTPEGAAQ
ncbi:hypothetical protein ACFV4G_26100, partial [Kitasatospora sp. NPDC059747]